MIVVAAVIEHEGQFLCMQKGETRFPYTSHRWEFPGGKVEAGETPQQALHRELLEEMDYDIEVGEHLITVTHHYPDFSITLQAYRCRAHDRHFVMREHAAHRWLPASQLLTLDWCAADLPIAQAITEGISIEFLGTGTSTGVPSLRCNCEVCRSTDSHDKRLRASVIVRYCGKSLLIDCGPDFRQQMLRASDDHLDALLLTHIHYDHVGGIDDLRAYCFDHPFPVYARQDVIDHLRLRLPYCFAEHPYPGVPLLDCIPINDNEPFTVQGITVEPIPVMHDQLPILGFRIGPMAYITDCKTISDQQVERLHGIPLLVINALRHEPHHSHLHLAAALDIIRRIAPAQAYLTHMAHSIGLHTHVETTLPPTIHLAHDNLIVRL